MDTATSTAINLRPIGFEFWSEWYDDNSTDSLEKRVLWRVIKYVQVMDHKGAPRTAEACEVVTIETRPITYSTYKKG